jgi:hypothetical protein
MRKDRRIDNLTSPDSGPGPPGLCPWLHGLMLPVCLLSAVACGCGRPDPAAIQSADPNQRILGIFAAATAGDALAVPLLVDRLEDEDEAVRFYAIIALDRITGQRFEYDYAKSASERARAVARWRRFVREGGHVGPGRTKDPEIADRASPARPASTRRAEP